MRNKHIFTLTIYCAFILLASCATVPIVKPVKYYSPRSSAQVVDYIPAGTIYIGMVKIVPRGDTSLTTEKQKQRAINKLQKSAAEAGADYVVIIDIQKSNRDYLLDFNYSDGYTIKGEMFRQISE